VELLHNAMHALVIIGDPVRLAFIVLGVVLGLVIGVIPGIGGLGGMALLIPFTYGMDAYTAVAFLIGMWAVTATSDTVPAILFGVPGAIGSASTVLDGFPMAKRGEAGRAFGASFSASVLGGLFGAALLAISIPILRPVMLAIGTPELLAVCVLGLALVAAVSQGAVLKGLVAAIMGLLLASVGNEEQTGTLRWVLGTSYLWDGVPMECLALGLFAIPELVDMAVARRAISETSRGGLLREQMRGVRDTLINWKLVINSATIGVLMGSIPGMGAAVIDWVAYGSAARMCKGAAQSFGTGDVRGVIASEAANNSREGGSLIPTLAFGVPGSASMALLLGAFMAHDITPGPKLLTSQLDVTFTMIWSLALANVLGAAICFLFANQFAKVVTIRPGILVPCITAVCFVGAYQGSRSFGDLVVLLAFGALGWLMKRCRWPRPPLILGFILGKLLEKYLFISTLRYGASWVERPGVIVVITIAVLVLAWPLLGRMMRGNRAERLIHEEPGGRAFAARRKGEMAMWGAAGLCFLAAFLSAMDWKFAPRLMPQTAAAAGLIVVTIAAFGARPRVVAGDAKHGALTDALATMRPGQLYGRALEQFLWLGVLLGAVSLIGMLPSLLLFMTFHMAITGRVSWRTSLLVALPLWVGMYLLFVKILHLPWPDSLLGDVLPALRAQSGRLI
jgi:TctA family transporter